MWRRVQHCASKQKQRACRACANDLGGARMRALPMVESRGTEPEPPKATVTAGSIFRRGEATRFRSWFGGKFAT